MLVRVIGPLRAERADGTSVSLRPMERRLLAALVAVRPSPASTDVLADALWPGGPPPSARKTIQTNVLRIRGALGAGVIVTAHGGYGLGPAVRVDVDDIEPGRGQRAGCAPPGHFGPGAETLVEVSHWDRAEPVRARIDELRRVAERERLAALVDRRDPSAVAECEAHVAGLPLDEAGWCLLVTALRDAGRGPEALRACERSRRTLLEELGSSPGPALQSLYASLLVADRPDPDVSGPPSLVDAVPAGPSSRGEDALRRSGTGWQTGMDATDPVVLELEAALAEVPPGPTPLRARLLARWAVACSHHRPASDCVDAARRSMATARALSSVELLAEAAHALAVVLSAPGQDAERRRWADVLAELGERHGRTEWRAWALPVLARSECLAGNLDEATRLLEEHGGPESALLDASVRGDWDGARRAAAELRRLQAERLFDPHAAALQEMGILGIVALHEGTAVAEAPSHLEWPLDALTISIRAWQAAALARSGDTGSAGAVLDALEPSAIASLECDGYLLPLHAMLADAAHLSGRAATAEVVVAAVEPHLGSTIVDPGLLYRGAVTHAAGLAAATLGRDGRARELLADAAEVHRSHGSGWMLRRSLAAVGAPTSARPARSG